MDTDSLKEQSQGAAPQRDLARELAARLDRLCVLLGDDFRRYLASEDGKALLHREQASLAALADARPAPASTPSVTS